MTAMIDFRSRLSAVHAALAVHYHMTDTQAADILLASRLETRPSDPPLPFPWIVLETGFAGDDVESTWPWFQFGLAPHERNHAQVVSIARCRQRVSETGLDLKEITKGTAARSSRLHAVAAELNRNRPLTLIEPAWTAGWYQPLAEFGGQSKNGHGRGWLSAAWEALVEFRTLRIRSVYPKTNLISTSARLDLGAAAKEALDCRFRERAPEMRALPGEALYWAEVTQKFAARFTSWDDLIKNLSSLASRLAWLRNKPAPDQEEWRDIGRVLRDCVPWIWHVAIPQLAPPGRTLRTVKTPLAGSGTYPSIRWFFAQVAEAAARGAVEYIKRKEKEVPGEGFDRKCMFCGGKCRKDGRKKLGGVEVQVWICVDCGRSPDRVSYGKWVLTDPRAVKLTRYEEDLF